MQSDHPVSVERPPIIGLAHVGLFVSDISKAEEFYGHVLGYGHFSLDKPTGGLMLNYYKVNDHQYIEVYPGLKGDEQDRLPHVGFETYRCTETAGLSCRERAQGAGSFEARSLLSKTGQGGAELWWNQRDFRVENENVQIGV